MAEDLTQKLKEKYVSVISVMNREDFRIQNVHAEGQKLVIRAEAPSQQASNHFWDAVKKVDSNFAQDLNAQITIRQQPQQQQAGARVTSPPPSPKVAPVAGSSQAGEGGAEKTYTVQKGDTLSEIAKQFYGN
jgi:LysM repeat protein